jgi:pyruvate dehydrogenase E1 component alpha subunit
MRPSPIWRLPPIAGRSRPARWRAPTGWPNTTSSSASRKKAYRDMLLIRRFEEKAGQLYGMGLIGGFCHLYIGQEAVVVGMRCRAEGGRPGHHLLSRPRPHAGLRHGPQGRDGRADRPPGRLLQGQGRLDAHVLQGEALLRRPRHRRRPGAARHRLALPTSIAATTVCLTYFGDGAANQGQVYETFNMAALWKLPVVFVIENNRYAMGTSVKRSSAHRTSHCAARSSAFRARQVDGMDVARCTPRAKRREHCRSGKGPYHSGNADLPLSRPLDVGPGEVPHRDEVQKMREEHDPIEQVKRPAARAKRASARMI